MKNSETFSNSSTFFILMGIDLIMIAFVIFQDVIIMESLFYLNSDILGVNYWSNNIAI